MLEGGVKTNILIKETSFKTESRSPVGGALTQVPLLAACQTRRKKEDNSFSKGGHFSRRNFISCFYEKEGGSALALAAAQ